MNVTDNAGSDDANGFLDGNKHLSSGENDYKYDQNDFRVKDFEKVFCEETEQSSMILDRNKGIESITYNHLNLPVNISFEIGRSIQYTYNAAGQKVKKFVENNGSYEIIDYLDASTQLSTGSFQYAGEVLQYFPTTEGYVNVTPLLNNTTPVAYRFNYVYNYTDHLGNIRVSYTKNPQNGKLKILDENHYYPFGLKHERYLPLEKWKFIIDQQDLEKTKLKVALTDEYKYKYQGQELQDELGFNWYSFKWRNYMPDIGRFFNYDPLAEKYSDYTPYQFSSNQVVHAKEIEGLENSADLNQQRWQKQYLKGEISNEQLMDNYKAQFDGAVTGLSLILPGEEVLVGAFVKWGTKAGTSGKIGNFFKNIFSKGNKTSTASGGKIGTKVPKPDKGKGKVSPENRDPKRTLTN